MPPRDDYEEVARQIARYLAERQRPDGSFPGPDHYGVAFSLWLWSHFGGEFAQQAEQAWQRLAEHPPRTHGEFNAYALLSCAGCAPAPVRPLLERLRFGRRHSANWMLLRAVCRAEEGPPVPAARGALDGRAALLRYARRGFIADRPGVRSFAYHAFCGALLTDLWRHRRWRWAGRAAARAAHFIAPFVLPSGDAIYVGRGQEQIFGYGALIFLLEAAAQITGQEPLRAAADRVFGHLLRFRRPDGSFPLVLREEEPAEPWSPELRSGWYSYNRYADYLPFLGCFLLKAARPAMALLGEVDSAPAHPDFKLWQQGRYTAVLARPGGASTNDLAFPYVCADGVSLFPCYGAERRTGPEGMPLPYGVLANGRSYPFREQLGYRLTESGLAGVSALAQHVRSFEFASDGFVCRDEIRFRRRGSLAQLVPANFLFRNLQALADGGFETSYRGARAHLHLVPPGRIHPQAATTASGQLAALRQTRGPCQVAGDEVISVELRVSFP